MALEIKIEISAEPALLAALQALAGGNAKTENVNASKLYQSCIKVVTPEKTPEAPVAAPEKPAEIPAEPKKEENPEAVIDEKLLPAIRKTVNEFCKMKGKDEGKAEVKKWLNDHEIGGLSKMTYGQADEFCAWLEKELEVAQNAG